MRKKTLSAVQNKTEAAKSLSALGERGRGEVKGWLMKPFVALICLWALLAQPVPAASLDLAKKINFDIPAQSLSTALIRFSEQTGLQFTAPAAELNSVQVSAVRGELPLNMALEQLLRNTRFTYQPIDQNTIAITTKNPPSAGTGLQTVRLAQNETEAAAEENKENNSLQNRDNDSESGGKGIPEILIKGSRSSNLDIKRTRDDVQPYVVFDRDRIEKSESLSLEDFFKAQLPMNAARQSLDQRPDVPSSAQGGINLRGLGANQTLILVDGRRLPGMSTLAAGFAQTDISGIPLSSIERIEVLPTSAGAIYGGSATGGVINIVRKRDYSGLDVRAKYGNTLSSDVRDVAYDLNAGFAVAKTSVSITAAYAESNPLLATERDFAARSRALLLANSPSTIASSSQPPSGTTPNICSAVRATPTFGLCTSAPLVLDNGQALGSAFTSVPSGYSGPSDGGAGLAPNAGRYNLEVPTDGQYLLRAPTKKSFSANIRQGIGQWIELQVDGSLSESASKVSTGATSVAVLVPSSQPSNPFRQDVVVSVPVSQARRISHSESEIREAAASLIFRLPYDWAAVVDRNWGRTEYSYQQKSGNLLSAEGQALLAANAFRDFRQNPLDLSSYLTLGPDLLGGPHVQTLDDLSFRVSGAALKLPAGSLSVAASFQRRKEHARGAFVQQQYINSTLFAPPRSQSVDSYYLEARVPVFSPDNSIRLINSLELQASVRRDAYETYSTANFASAPTPSGPFQAAPYYTNDVSSLDHLVGLRYEPTKDVAIRGSVSTGFLPAGLNQIVPSISTARSASAIDPRRGGGTVNVPYTAISGGNPNLEPEDSRSWSVGVIVTPRFTEGLRLSLDYTKIKKNGEIVTPPLQFLLDNESIYPGRISRGASLPGDAAGWAGPITQIDSSLLNVLYSSASALDIQLDYRWNLGDWGNLEFTTVATQARQFKRKLAVNTREFDSVGYADGPLRWKGGAGLTWERGAWRVSWSGQYFDDYFIIGSNPTSAAFNAGTLARQGEPTIDRQDYHDVTVGYRFLDGAWLLSNTSISLGLQNVFNSSPPITALSSADSPAVVAYSGYGDPRLRRYMISVQKSFAK